MKNETLLDTFIGGVVNELMLELQVEVVTTESTSLLEEEVQESSSQNNVVL